MAGSLGGALRLHFHPGIRGTALRPHRAWQSIEGTDVTSGPQARALLALASLPSDFSPHFLCVGTAEQAARGLTACPYLVSTAHLPGTTLRPWWDAQSATVTPPVPPSRPGGPDQTPKGHPGLLRPQASEQPASPQCPGDQGPVAPAEAPIILSSPRTSKTDSYELVWRPRHEGSSRAPVLYYVVKHRKV